MDSFVTVLTFTYPSEAAVIRGRLASEGIFCFLKNEMAAQANPFYSNAFCGVELQVKRSDLNRAIDILKEAGYIKEKNWQPEK